MLFYCGYENNQSAKAGSCDCSELFVVKRNNNDCLKLLLSFKQFLTNIGFANIRLPMHHMDIHYDLTSWS